MPACRRRAPQATTTPCLMALFPPGWALLLKHELRSSRCRWGARPCPTPLRAPHQERAVRLNHEPVLRDVAQQRRQLGAAALRPVVAHPARGRCQAGTNGRAFCLSHAFASAGHASTGVATRRCADGRRTPCEPRMVPGTTVQAPGSSAGAAVLSTGAGTPWRRELDTTSLPDRICRSTRGGGRGAMAEAQSVHSCSPSRDAYVQPQVDEGLQLLLAAGEAVDDGGRRQRVVPPAGAPAHTRHTTRSAAWRRTVAELAAAATPQAGWGRDCERGGLSEGVGCTTA